MRQLSRTSSGALVLTCAVMLSWGTPSAATAQNEVRPAPPRGADDGGGPYERLIIRGVNLIDGTGAPPTGPVDVVIEGNRIAEVRTVGYPGLPIDPARRPQGATREIDAHGQYLLPGFVDLHTHNSGAGDFAVRNPDTEYIYKLTLAHGITTVRDAGRGDLSERARSARNEIVAPRIFAYQRYGWDYDRPIRTPEDARQMVRHKAQQGVDGLKLGAEDPEIMEALIDEARRHGMGTMAHLAQGGVGRMNTLNAARLGLGTATHFYGLFESLLKDYRVQDWPMEVYNNNDEYHRFGQVGRLWDQIHPPGSQVWNDVIQEFVELGLTLDPTMTIYVANRDVMKHSNADWHHHYTRPELWDFFQPSRENHGSYWFNWTTHDEVAWRNFYRVWMQFINDFKNAGGRVTTGSDSGYIYQTYGFGYIGELELLQEAGLHPLEVIRAATLNGAETLHEPKGIPIEFGIIRPGLLADLVLVEENPLENFKVLYGTGAVRLNDETGEVERVGGVRYTIKDGIVYDARQLLAEVRDLVDAAWAQWPGSVERPALLDWPRAVAEGAGPAGGPVIPTERLFYWR
ncbi:MAG: amidohydrolase family protein [Gemmatimonadota bacterium]